MEMTTFWDYRLIALSVVIAIVGSYLALDFAGRLKTSQGKARRHWFLAGALTMGLGIWSMHFVGMLALQMSMPVSYDPYFMFLSIVAAAIGAGIAFFILNRQSVGPFPLMIASVAMGLAIASMHYIGMASMKMPAKIQYEPILFALSILIAIIASGAALRIAFQLRRANPSWVVAQKVGSAVLMGIAISGMHYTGMAAATYVHTESLLGGLNRDPMVGTVPLEHVMVLAAGVFGLALLVLSAQMYAEHQRTLATLQESELRFRNLADTAPMYMAMADETGNAVYFNKPWLDWTGRTMDEMKGLGWLCTLHPDDAPRFEQDFKHAFENQVPINEEYRFRRVDGEYRWMMAVGAPRFDPHGRFIGYFGTYTDFHELKEAQIALQKSEERYHLVIEGSNDGIWDWDHETGTIFWSKRCYDQLGVPYDTVITPGFFFERMHPDDKPVAMEVIKAHLEEDKPYNLEVRLRHESGEYGHYLARGISVRDKQGKPTRTAGVRTDITQIRQAEDALKESEERFRTMADSAPVSVFVTDTEPKNIYVNKAWLDYTGLPLEAALSDEWYTIVHPEDTWYFDKFMQAFSKQETLETEIRAKRANGEYGWLLISAGPRYIENGRFVGYIGSGIDITERKQAEKALQTVLGRERLTRRVAELSNKTMDLDTILSTVSEELGKYFGVDRAIVAHFEQMGGEFKVNFVAQYCSTNDIRPIDLSNMSPKLMQILFQKQSPNYLRDLVRTTTMAEYAAYARKQLEGIEELTPDERDAFHREMVTQLVEAHQIRSNLRVPVTYRGMPYGTLTLQQCVYDRAWSDEEVEILQELATQIGNAFYQIDLYRQEQNATEALQKSFEREHLIRKVVEIIGQSFDINVILKTVAEEVGHYLQVDRASVSRYYVDEGKLILDASAQYTHEGVKPLDNEDIELLIKAVQHLTPETITQGEPQITNIANQEEYVAYMRERMSHFNFPDLPTEKLIDMVYKYEIQASLRVSIRYRGIPYGSISVSQTSYNRQWQPEEVELLKAIADHAGSAIYQTELYRQEQMAKEEAEKRLRRESLMRRLVEVINQTQDVRLIMDTVARELAQFLNVDRALLTRYTFDAAAQKLDLLLATQYCADETVQPMSDDDIELILKSIQNVTPEMLEESTDQVTAMNNVEEAKERYRERLEKMQVNGMDANELMQLSLKYGNKSALRAAIFYRGIPYGSIGLHQCSHYREWQADEVDLLNSVADQMGIALAQAELYLTEQEAKEEAKVRAHQQEVVTELGLKALSGIELPELMNFAVATVAKTLDVEYCKLLESLSDGEELFLRAGFGWQEGLVGSTTEKSGVGSPAGYVLLREEPVIVEDLRTETRFSASPLLQDHHVVSGISVVIFMFGKPWGVMGAYSKQLRKFSKQDVNFFQSVANVIATAIERKQIEQEKDRAKDEAQEASRKKSEFLAMMSHELRTPLNSILGYSRMIENGMGGPLTDDQAKYIKNVGSSGNHLLNIVNDLLDVSKVEAGKMVISPGTVDVIPIVNEIQSMLEELAQKNDVFISFQVQPDIDTIEADPSRFKQILINLTSNAIKFNKKGGSVSVRLNKTEDGEWLIGEVQDTGIGIPLDKQAELFKKFYQVDASASRPHEGTGLGLALTKELIELHGGEIRLESEEGTGSTFAFRLPTRARVLEKVEQS